MTRKEMAPRVDRRVSRPRKWIRHSRQVGSLVYLARGRKSWLQHFLFGLAPRTAEEILEIFIWLMRLRLKLDTVLRWFRLRPYRPYFESFHGCCQFIARDGSVKLLIKFDNGTVNMHEGIDPNADVTIAYADGRAVMNCLLSPIWNLFERRQDQKASEPDTFNVLDGVLNNTIQISGNPSYLFRFGFLANYLLLELTGELPQ